MTFTEKDFDDVADRLVATSRSFVERIFEVELEAGIGNSDIYESQIELCFAAAASALIRVGFPQFRYSPFAGDEFDDLVDCARCSIPKFMGVLAPQVKIGNYRADFMLVHMHGLNGWSGIVVECDGHDFHERTKQQATRDKARDRYIQKCGFKVMRFTGSEIWKDPMKCALEVISTGMSLAIDAECNKWLMENGQEETALRNLSRMVTTP